MTALLTKYTQIEIQFQSKNNFLKLKQKKKTNKQTKQNKTKVINLIGINLII